MKKKITHITLAQHLSLWGVGVFLFCAIFFRGCFVEAPIAHEVYTVQWLTHLDDLFDSCGKRDMLLFDVDDTLISSRDPFSRGELPWTFRLLATLKHPSILWGSNWEEYYSRMWAQAKREVIEPAIIHRLAALRRRKGVWIFGLTSMESGSYGVIPSMPEWRYNQLHELNIRFTNRCRGAVLDESLPAYRGTYPLLYNGIICCNQQPKGKVLAALLTERSEIVLPHRIIAIDDDYQQLQSIGDTCKERGIACELIHYTGGRRLQREWSLRKALRQLDDLIAKGQWRE
ncbi:MAG: DUF2608 domain-containing protein [Candidatus Dependentiae bacterium]|jgi:hypothetical protein